MAVDDAWEGELMRSNQREVHIELRSVLFLHHDLKHVLTMRDVCNGYTKLNVRVLCSHY